MNLFTEGENTDKKSVLKLLKMTLGLDPHNRTLSFSPVKNSNKIHSELVENQAESDIEF